MPAFPQEPPPEPPYRFRVSSAPDIAPAHGRSKHWRFPEGHASARPGKKVTSSASRPKTLLNVYSIRMITPRVPSEPMKRSIKIETGTRIQPAGMLAAGNCIGRGDQRRCIRPASDRSPRHSAEPRIIREHAPASPHNGTYVSPKRWRQPFPPICAVFSMGSGVKAQRPHCDRNSSRHRRMSPSTGPENEKTDDRIESRRRCSRTTPDGHRAWSCRAINTP